MNNGLYILALTQVHARELARLLAYRANEFTYVTQASTIFGVVGGVLLVHGSARTRNDYNAIVQRAKMVNQMRVLMVDEAK
jgi:fatty acid/phospholipid biosynthesis enzyme